MAQRVSIRERQGYASELAGLWSGLARTLSRLDEIAADPVAVDPAELARLQYALHLAGERVFGLEPPAGAEAGHAELAAALAAARDSTAEVADAVAEDGRGAVALHVHEWRGALFRVRLARMRLAGRPRVSGSRRSGLPAPGLAAPLAALVLTVAGASAFVFGATVAAWPIWLAGILAVVGGLLVYRP